MLYLTVYIVLQCLDGYMPVIRNVFVCTIFRGIVGIDTLATDLQMMMIEEPGKTIDIFSNLTGYLVISATLLLFFCLYVLV